MLLPFVLIVSCFLSFSNGAENCPLFGPLFPKPLSLAASATMQAAFKNLTTTFTNRDADNSTGALTNSYSLEIFSASDPTPIFQYSHTASNLADINTEGGVSQVDGDTVFRIGSLTKIFTIFTFLVEDGDAHFSSPITKFIPELATIAQNTSGNAITRVPWEDITIGELASHLVSDADWIIIKAHISILPNAATTDLLPLRLESQQTVSRIYPTAFKFRH